MKRTLSLVVILCLLTLRSYSESTNNAGVPICKATSSEHEKGFAEFIKRAESDGVSVTDMDLTVPYLAILWRAHIDSKEGLSALEHTAEAGDFNCQMKLGIAYFMGGDLGVTADGAKAVKWLQKAAVNKEHYEAEFLLGILYQNAIHGAATVSNDFKESIRWLQRAADKGCIPAQMYLGVAYAGASDYNQSLVWMKKAADTEHPYAQFNLGVLYDHGPITDKKEAAKWLRKAADQGQCDAQFLLGYYYSTGDGVEKDPVEAYKWILLAEKGKCEMKQFQEVSKAVRDSLELDQFLEARKRAKAFMPHRVRGPIYLMDEKVIMRQASHRIP